MAPDMIFLHYNVDVHSTQTGAVSYGPDIITTKYARLGLQNMSF